MKQLTLLYNHTKENCKHKLLYTCAVQGSITCYSLYSTRKISTTSSHESLVITRQLQSITLLICAACMLTHVVHCALLRMQDNTSIVCGSISTVQPGAMTAVAVLNPSNKFVETVHKIIRWC